jgi:hypothetical protein
MDLPPATIMRPPPLLGGLLFAFLVWAAPAFTETAPALIDDSSQSADLANDRTDRSIFDDRSQSADLGNDMADRAIITDESQTEDLH